MCSWREICYTFKETSVAKALLQTSQINETCSSLPESLHYTTRQLLLKRSDQTNFTGAIMCFALRAKITPPTYFLIKNKGGGTFLFF